MAVVIATTTNGKYMSLTSTSGTLATSVAEVLEELSTQNKSLNQTRFVTFFDDTGQEFTFVAIVKN